MNLMLKNELKKSFTNKRFKVALVINCVITVVAAVSSIYYYLYQTGVLIVSENPWLPVFTLYRYWIGDDANNVIPYIFYSVLPLTSCLAYGGSYLSDVKTGYIKNIITRTSKKSYFLSKYVTVFLSGAIIAFVPIVLNILTVACFVPAVKPDVFYTFSYLHYSTLMFSDLFFSHPVLYLIAMATVTTGFSGLFACLSLSISFFVKNKIAVTALPFVILLFFNYFTGLYIDKLGTIGELSPLKFLHATAGNYIYLHIVLTELVIFIFLTFFITMIKGVTSDVY